MGRERTLEIMLAFEERKKLIDMPIDEFAGKLKFKNGVFEVFLYFSYRTSFLIHDDMFDVVQSRSDELNDAGYKTFKKEDERWYGVGRTYYVWSKQKTLEMARAKDHAVIFVSISLMLLFIFVLFICFR